MAQKRRPHEVKFHVDEAELQIIRRKMAQVGTTCMAAYLRKMALDGHVLRLELPELREMISLLRRTSNNTNQIARRVNSTGRIYDTDTEQIRHSIDAIWQQQNLILEKLAAL